MKWKTTRRRNVNWGEKRTVLRFALFPTLVDTDDEKPTRVWLERYHAYQEAGDDGYGGLQWRTISKYSRGLPF